LPDKCRSLKKVRKILSIVLLSLLGIIILTGILVNIPAVQHWLVQEATRRLSDQLQTKVEIKGVSLRLFNRAHLEGTYIEDRHKDTLLYAGVLEVRITDWFFFQDKPILKYIGLQDAQINLVRPRNDSLWNYQFIVDAFGSSPPDTSRKTSSQSGVSLDLRKIDLRNVRINKIDAWVGENMLASARRIYLDAKNLDLEKHNVDIQELLLDQPSFIVQSYSSSPLRKRKPKSNDTPTPAIDSTGQLRWNSSNWKLIVKELAIRNGVFGVEDLEDSSAVEEGYFAPQHIRFANINLTLDNTSLVKDSIIGDLALSTKERSGFEVKKLSARFKMSPVEMEFSQMDLITNRSHLRDYYTMQYTDLDDMSDYVDLVFMKARFVNSTLSSDDIAYFAPPLSGWKREIALNGVVEGPVSNLDADSVSLQAGSTTSLKGRMKMRGLPDIDETFIDFQAEQLVTTGNDVQRIFPSIKDVQPLHMDRLSAIAFQGSFTGFVNDFVAYGKFQTNLGNVDSDLNFKTSGDVPVYSGSLVTNNFNLGTLMDVPQLSTISLNAKINGAGFNLKTLKAEVDADVKEIALYDYTYTNIRTNGEMNRKFFNGSLTVNDPNLDMDFAGTIDFNGPVPIFKFNSEIRKSHLKALKLTSDSITLQTRLDLNFAGSNIDNFDGTARVYDVSLYKNQSRVDFDSVNVSTHLENNIKVLDITGSEISGYVKGAYSFMGLPDAFRLFLGKYYPSFFSSPPADKVRQDFTFDFQFGEVDKLIRAFTTQVSGFDQTRISGALNTIQGDISLNANVPLASYQGYKVQDLQLKAKGNFNKIDVSTAIGKVSSGDQVYMQNPLIIASSSHDTSFVKMDMQSQDSSDLDGFYARVITVNEGVKINFLNSAFTVNDRQWNMTPGNEIYWSKHFLTISNLQVTRNDQSITIETNEFNPDESRFMISLKNLNLADLIPQQLITMPIEGLANGSINISDPTRNLDIDADITTTGLRLNNDSLGLVTIKGGFRQQNGEANYEITSRNAGRSFLIKGIAGLSKENNQLAATVDLNGASIDPLNRYLGDYVTDLSGLATGQLTVSGTTAKPSVKGKVQLDSAGIKVLYLGTYYKIPRLNINVDDNLIEFGNFSIIDKYNNRASASGYISHDHFSKLNFDFDVTGRKFLFMNTTEADSDLFYGDVIADGKVYFSGPLNDMQMHILARPVQGTHFYLPMSDSKDIGKYDYITFKTYGTEMQPVKKKKKDDVKLNIRLDIAANPDAQIDVILDATTGDVISANGNGNLQINVNTDGDFTMFGDYEINNGSYNFTFQRLTSWKFDITKNSTIAWNGDPREARMNITAKYSVPKVSLYNLVGQMGSVSSDKLATRQERVDVVINLRGEMMKPDIAYEIQLPDVGTMSYESGVAARLREINQDQNKALLQMYGLLLFNQFIPDDNTATGGAGVVGRNSVGQALSAQASAILNNITGALLKNSGIGINLNYRAYNIGNQNNDNIDRNQLSAGITGNLLNNRIRIYVGGDYDWGNTTTAANSNRFAGDFRVEYLLTPDGRIRVNAFSKTDYDVYNLVNRNKAGLGISYVREYNRLRELFESRRPSRRLLDSMRRAEATKPEDDSTREKKRES
jgi:autotransporter translocation and assembly factor TamB